MTQGLKIKIKITVDIKMCCSYFKMQLGLRLKASPSPGKSEWSLTRSKKRSVVHHQPVFMSISLVFYTPVFSLIQPRNLVTVE